MLYLRNYGVHFFSTSIWEWKLQSKAQKHFSMFFTDWIKNSSSCNKQALLYNYYLTVMRLLFTTSFLFRPLHQYQQILWLIFLFWEQEIVLLCNWLECMNNTIKHVVRRLHRNDSEFHAKRLLFCEFFPVLSSLKWEAMLCLHTWL